MARRTAMAFDSSTASIQPNFPVTTLAAAGVLYQRVKLMWVAHPPGPEVLETARVVAARASMRALRLAPITLTT